MGEVSFSGPEVAMILALLSSVVTPLAVLFRLLMSAKDERINSLKEMLDRSETQADMMLPALEKQVQAEAQAVLSLVQRVNDLHAQIQELTRRYDQSQARLPGRSR